MPRVDDEPITNAKDSDRRAQVDYQLGVMIHAICLGTRGKLWHGATGVARRPKLVVTQRALACGKTRGMKAKHAIHYLIKYAHELHHVVTFGFVDSLTLLMLCR